MNIVKKIEQYNDNYLYFCEPIKNNIMNEGKFIRIIYSTSFFTLNGVYLLVPLNEVQIEKYFNKYKCMFSVNSHKELIENIKCIEDSILKKVNIRNKVPLFKIYEQLRNGNIKIFHSTDNVNGGNRITNHSFVLKISGIWETEMHYGLTFKFSKVVT